VDYSRWLSLRILLMDEKNEPIYLDLIRPVEWVIAMDAQEGKQIWLELEELNGRGWGRVMELSRCRKVLPGEGRVVTGTFSHRVQNLINVQVEGLKEPIGVTSNHPFWSEDRKEFVQAGSLQVGERLRAMVGGPDGGIARVTSVTPRGPPGSSEIVYNMEVEGEHAYQVTELGLVVHNTYKEWDLVKYYVIVGGKFFQKHHGVMNAWAKANIKNYSKGLSPTIVMLVEKHKLINKEYELWKNEIGMAGKAIDWTKISAREMKVLSDRLFKAGGVPEGVQKAYYSAFQKYLNSLPR
jgi:hypothetical protein